MTLVVPPANADALPVVQVSSSAPPFGLQLLDVTVRVDAARHHQQSVCIDGALTAQARPDRSDTTIDHTDVASKYIGRRNHRATGDHQIIVGHIRRPLTRVQSFRSRIVPPNQSCQVSALGWHRLLQPSAQPP